MIVFTNIPEEACIKLLTYDWGTSSSSGLIAVAYGSAAYNSYVGGSDSYTSRYVQLAEEGVMPVSKATSVCESSAASNYVSWKFY